LTVPVTVKGRLSPGIAGIAIRPPIASAISAPIPAAIAWLTAAGS